MLFFYSIMCYIIYIYIFLWKFSLKLNQIILIAYMYILLPAKNTFMRNKKGFCFNCLVIYFIYFNQFRNIHIYRHILHVYLYCSLNSLMLFPLVLQLPVTPSGGGWCTSYIIQGSSGSTKSSLCPAHGLPSLEASPPCLCNVLTGPKHSLYDSWKEKEISWTP